MNEKALSPIVGLALILASVVSVIAIYQTQTVPALLKEQEWEHYLIVKEKFETLSEKAEFASRSGGFVVVNFPLKLKYEGISFTPLTSSAGCTIKAERIGNVTVIYKGSAIPFEIVALKLIPKYNYLKADEEIFVLGRYFTSSGKPLEVSNGNKLIILDTNFDEISGNERLKFRVLPLISSSRGDVEVVVNSTENWLLDYLRNEFNAENVSRNTVSFNLTSIELVVASTSENVESKIEEGQLSVMVFNVSLLGGGAKLSKSNKCGCKVEDKNIALVNGDVIKVEFTDPTVRSVTLYITGYTSYFSKEINVSIVYSQQSHGCGGHMHHGGKGNLQYDQYDLNFIWSTLSNGYLQLPIEVFKPENTEKYRIDVTLMFEKEFRFTIEVRNSWH